MIREGFYDINYNDLLGEMGFPHWDKVILPKK
jgi:hypothetical protein